MCSLAHLRVGFGFFEEQLAAFFHRLEPGVFVDGEDAACSVVHHDVVRSAVVAHERGRAGRHGFYDHVPEGVRDAREQEEVGISIEARERFAALFACKMDAVVAFVEFLDFFEVPAVAHVHEFHVVVFGGELFPDAVQELQVLFLGNAADERETHLACGTRLCRFGAVVLLPYALAAQVGRELFERESAGQDFHLVFGNLQLRSEDVRVVLAGAHHGHRHAVEDFHEPEYKVVHPLRLHERARVGGHVGAVMTKDLDACDLRAEAHEPGAGARRLKFDEVDGVALEQPERGGDARDGKFAVRVPELFHAEQAGKQETVAVFHHTAGACIECVAGEEGLHAVGAHIRNHVPQVVRDAVSLVQVVGVEEDAHVIGGALAAFLLQVKAELQKLGQVQEQRAENDWRNHARAQVSGGLVLETGHLLEGTRDLAPEYGGAAVQCVGSLKLC